MEPIEPYTPYRKVDIEPEIRFTQTEKSLDEISKSIKNIADMNYNHMTKLSTAPVRDVLKYLIVPTTTGFVGTTAGILSGIIIHKLTDNNIKSTPNEETEAIH